MSMIHAHEQPHCQVQTMVEQKLLKVKLDSNFSAHEQTSNNIFKVKSS